METEKVNQIDRKKPINRASHLEMESEDLMIPAINRVNTRFFGLNENSLFVGQEEPSRENELRAFSVGIDE